MLEGLRNEFNPDAVLSVALGPKGDGYVVEKKMTAE